MKGWRLPMWQALDKVIIALCNQRWGNCKVNISTIMLVFERDRTH